MGLLAVFLMLETTLWVAGEWAYPEPDLASQTAGRCGPMDCPFTVLCLGDSFTAGWSDASYPSFLQLLLAGSDSRPTVLNAGMGGYNSNMIRSRLPELLDTSQPDLVILLAGTANQTNYFGYGDFKERGGAVAKARQLLFRVRSLRLLRYAITKLGQIKEESAPRRSDYSSPNKPDYLAWRQVHLAKRPLDERAQEDFSSALALLNLRSFELATGAFLSNVEAWPEDSGNYWGLGQLARQAGDFSRAREWFSKGGEADAGDPYCPFFAGEILMNNGGDLNLAAFHFRMGIEADPSVFNNYWALGMVGKHAVHPWTSEYWFSECIRASPEAAPCYDNLVSQFQDEEDWLAMKALLDELKGSSAIARDYLLLFEARERQQEVAAWVADDLAAMVRTCLDRGIAVLMQDYPGPDPLNAVLRKVAEEQGIPFVSQAGQFAQLEKGGAPHDYFFVTDGHCTPAGYRQMAVHLVQAIQAEGLLP